jgi:predicted chitinase
MQLTGKSNYQAFTNFYQEKYNSSTNFVSNPDQVTNNALISVLSAMWFFKDRVLDKVSDVDLENAEATVRLSGSKRTIDERQELLDDINQNINCEN